MTKVRKQNKRKRFNTNINRKRLRNRLSNLGRIECDPITSAWNRHKSTRTNLTDMGLAYDPNKIMKIPSYKESEKNKALAIIKEGFMVTQVEDAKPTIVVKTGVIKELESVAKAPRQSKFRLPNSHVEYIEYFIDKYGNDFKGMAKDRNNYNQETWRQLRQKVKKFMKAPKQYAKYLKSRNLLDKDLDEEELKKTAEALEMDSE